MIGCLHAEIVGGRAGGDVMGSGEVRRPVVMISSTARDLPKHREQVRLACHKAGFDPDKMMEHLTAESAGPVEVSLRMVADADVYLCILAHRYGFIPPGGEKSITNAWPTPIPTMPDGSATSLIIPTTQSETCCSSRTGSLTR
jgi:Domain of unknown function (DUF4062)